MRRSTALVILVACAPEVEENARPPAHPVTPKRHTVGLVNAPVPKTATSSDPSDDDVQDASDVPALRDECNASWPKRSKDFLDSLAALPKLKTEVAAKCKDLASHCSTFSGGTSVCRGISQRDQHMFDTTCATWPHVTVTSDDNKLCAGVDPASLELHFDATPAELEAARKAVTEP